MAGPSAKGDVTPAAELLDRAVENFLPLIRLVALRLLAEHHPDRVGAAVTTALRDPHRWVRLQAATIAAGRAMPELAAAIEQAVAREPSARIKSVLQAALAKATGAPPPAARPAANPADDTRRKVWSDLRLDADIDASPIEAFTCKYSSPELIARGKHVYLRTLWGSLPGPIGMVQEPRTLDAMWGQCDRKLVAPSIDQLDGLDLRFMGLGYDWDGSWRDFCREAGIDLARVGGDWDTLSVYERRAFDTWTLERNISGFNLIQDLFKLHGDVARPGLQISLWRPAHAAFKPEAAVALGRWKFDVNWRSGSYRQARMCKTIWPERPCVYSAPIVGPIPAPPTFVFETTEGVLGHAVNAWVAGAHLGLAMEAGSVLFKAAPPAKGRPSGLDDRLADGDGDAALGAEGPAAQAAADPADEAARIGRLLLLKHVYDCARIFASLPRFDPAPDALSIQWGSDPKSLTAPAGVPPVNASLELAGQYDLLPGINMLGDRDLGRYKLIVVHNGTLLRDETIEKLSRWLKETPGLLVIHQDLTADNAAEASTPADLDGVLRADWPWERDLVIHPAAVVEDVAPAELELTVAAGRLRIKADKTRSHAACLSEKAVPLAAAGDEAVLVRWRDPEHRGAVLFDGLRSPTGEYVKILAGEMNALAAQGIGRAVTGRPATLDVQTDEFHVAAAPQEAAAIQRPVTLSGIDLASGTVDPVVGPGALHAAIVPRQSYFHRYLACTPRIVALGDREFSQAVEAAGGGLLLRNAGVIQLAGRGPLQVTRQNGGALAAVPFDYAWVLGGKTEGVAVFGAESGGQLTFVRCAEPVVVVER